MKAMVAVFLLASLSLASAASVVRRDVNEVASAKEEFLALFKWDKIGKIVVEYLYRDAEVQGFVRYLGSDEFKDIVKELDAASEYQEVLAYLQRAGINAVKIHNVVHVLLGLPTLAVGSDVEGPRIVGGMLGFVQDLAGVVDRDELMRWFHARKSTELFQALLNLPAQPFVEKLAPKLTNLPQVKALVLKLHSLGLSLPDADELPKL